MRKFWFCDNFQVDNFQVYTERDIGEKSSLLPDDAMINIFLRLPVKDLAKLRCVCKTWNSVITSRAFFESLSTGTMSNLVFYYPDFGNSKLGLFFERNQKFLQLKNPPFGYDLKDFSVLGSCHGVLCLCKNDPSFIYMWNPSTNKYVTLPRPPYSPRHLGFGISDRTNCLDDFKVVAICASGGAEVYSLKMNRWKILPNGFFRSIDLTSRYYDHPILLNGFVHWCARVSCYADSKCPWLIVSFNFENEIFQTIRLPDSLSDEDGYKFLNVMNGRLCLFAATGGDKKFLTYKLWVMMEYGVFESWSRIYTFENTKTWWPLGFSTMGTMLARGFCKHGKDALLKYAPDKKKFKCLENHIQLPIQVLNFSESIISPNTSCKSSLGV